MGDYLRTLAAVFVCALAGAVTPGENRPTTPTIHIHPYPSFRPATVSFIKIRFEVWCHICQEDTCLKSLALLIRPISRHSLLLITTDRLLVNYTGAWRDGKANQR